MAKQEFNINDKDKDVKSHQTAVYMICILVLILTVLLDIYFITGIFD